MKKQILLLAFSMLAILASNFTAFGQLVASTIPPEPIACTSDALHPLAGQSYPYTVTNTNGVVPTDYSWWITKNPNFLTLPSTASSFPDESGKLTVTAGQLIATDATGTTSVVTVPASPYPGAGDAATINVTWSPEILAATKFQNPVAGWATATPAAPTPTFVAVMANGSCTNNLQVYEIDPKPSFTVDISNIAAGAATAAGYAIDIPQCVDKVRGAVYSPGTIAMDYGTNTLYFEVIAANFVTSWRPRFEIMPGSLLAGQTADIYYGSTLPLVEAGTYLEAGTLGLGVGGSVTGNVDLTTALPNTAAGVSVYVKVVIHNGKQELAAADLPFKLAVDGLDKTGQYDLVNSSCADPAAYDQSDVAIQTVTKRPDVVDMGIAPNFIPKN